MLGVRDDVATAALSEAFLSLISQLGGNNTYKVFAKLFQHPE